MAERLLIMLDRWTLVENTSVTPTQYVISDPEGRLVSTGSDEQYMTAKFHDYVFAPHAAMNRRARTIPAVDLQSEDTPTTDELRRALFGLGK